MKTKTPLDCTQGCGFRTKSQEMLKRHLSQKHNVGKGTPGRKALGDKKKKRSEINHDHYAGAKKAKEKKKAIIRRWLASFRQRYLRKIFPRWQARIVCAPPETVLMKLDGLPVPNRMPPEYKSTPSPTRKGPRPPKPISLNTDGARYKISVSGVVRENWP